MWRKLIISVMGLALAASLSACSTDITIGADCVDDTDCALDEYCDPAAGVCTADPACLSVNDCPVGLACGDDGLCDFYPCQVQADCPGDSLCDANGVCN